MKLLIALMFSLPLLAEATCMAMCGDSDNGLKPQIPGIVTLTVRCAAPGRPSPEKVTKKEDKCKDSIMYEQICDSSRPGYAVPKTVKYDCRKCVKGACKDVGEIID